MTSPKLSICCEYCGGRGYSDGIDGRRLCLVCRGSGLIASRRKGAVEKASPSAAPIDTAALARKIALELEAVTRTMIYESRSETIKRILDAELGELSLGAAQAKAAEVGSAEASVSDSPSAGPAHCPGCGHPPHAKRRCSTGCLCIVHFEGRSWVCPHCSTEVARWKSALETAGFVGEKAMEARLLSATNNQLMDGWRLAEQYNHAYLPLTIRAFLRELIRLTAAKPEEPTDG